MGTTYDGSKAGLTCMMAWEDSVAQVAYKETGQVLAYGMEFKKPFGDQVFGVRGRREGETVDLPGGDGPFAGHGTVNEGFKINQQDMTCDVTFKGGDVVEDIPMVNVKPGSLNL